jgi:VIT1/CCC1 family predicted Fe2+/Mn2+ transporter
MEKTMQSISKRIADAIAAYRRKDLEATKQAHTREAIEKASEQHLQESGTYIGEAVYGALDGIVTTFAVVAGVAGANLSAGIVLVLGFANLVGDGLSMGVGSYLSTKSRREYERSERQRERWEIDNYPDGEIHEVREIYARKGFEGEDLDRAVAVITSDKDVWVETMMNEELGIVEERGHPFFNGLSTFLSFIFAGFIPLLFFVVGLAFPEMAKYSFQMSVLLTAIALFAVGSLRVLVTQTNWFRSGLEMLVVGGAAAAGAYMIGNLLQGLV